MTTTAIDTPAAPAQPAAPPPDSSLWTRFWFGMAHPRRWLNDICGGEAAFPLLVLFGLNAVDELDRTAFGILLPNIREAFDIDIQTALVDRRPLVGRRARPAGADRPVRRPVEAHAARGRRCTGLGHSSPGMTGLATGLIILTVARSGSSLGKAFIDPTHNSLIADYYPVENRSRVYSFHRAANAVGAFIGPITAGMLAYWFSWRVPFLVFVIPTVIFAILALRLKEPVRGRWERHATGASQEIIDTEEESPSFSESWRTVHKVRVAPPDLVEPAVPVDRADRLRAHSAALFYEQEFDLGERGRGFAAAISEPFQLIGLIVGARIATRRFIGNVKGMFRFLASIAMGAGGLLVFFALSPNLYVAIALNCLISASLAIIGPGILASLSLAIPPRARATGFSVASLWIIPGLLVLPVHRLGRRHLVDPDRHARDDADLLHRSADPALRRRRDRRRHQAGLGIGRRPIRGAVRPPPGQHHPAAHPWCRSRLRRAHRAPRHQPRTQRGRGRRTARHERCRQVDAVEGDQRRGRSRPRRHRARRSRHHPRSAERDRRRSASSRCPAARVCSDR